MRKLADALSARGYEADFDQADYDPARVDSGISAEDDWWQRLQSMIAASEVMVFVVSPDSAASTICSEEIAYARGLGKRIIPILRRPIQFNKAPPRLTALNVKIPFVEDAQEAFDSSFEDLCLALETDIAWYREGRRLTELALRWDQRGRPGDLLLSPGDVRAVGTLLEKRPQSAPDPSPLLAELRDRSRARLDQDEQIRKRLLRATMSMMAAIIVGLVAWINQDTIKERANWFWTMRPYMLANYRPYLLRAAEEAQLKPRDIFRECSRNCPVMIVIPPGQYVMGSPENEPERFQNEAPQHLVTIGKAFAVSIFDVTFDEWEACVAVGGCSPVHDSGFGTGLRPVTNVTWFDAKQYVEWLSRMTGKEYRLPSEAEWEYFARGGTTTAFYWGTELGKWHANCVICGTEWDNTKSSPVGSFRPNPFGLFDVSGNVWQWLEDCYHTSYAGAPTDGSAWTTGDCSLRSDRGGSFISKASNMRVAYRGSYTASSRNYSTGIRVVRSLQQ